MEEKVELKRHVAVSNNLPTKQGVIKGFGDLLPRKNLWAT